MPPGSTQVERWLDDLMEPLETALARRPGGTSPKDRIHLEIARRFLGAVGLIFDHLSRVGAFIELDGVHDYQPVMGRVGHFAEVVRRNLAELKLPEGVEALDMAKALDRLQREENPDGR